MGQSIRLRQAMGIALVAFGVLLGNTLYEFLGKSINLVNLCMFIGVVWIPNYRNLLKLKLPQLTRRNLLLILFQFYLLFLLTFNNGSFASGDFFTDLMFIVFAIALIVAIMSNSNSLDWSLAIKACFWVSVLIVLIVGFVIFTSGNAFSGRFRFSSGADPLQMGLSLTTCFCTLIIYQSKNIIVKMIRIIAIMGIILEEFAFSCRTAIFICVIMLVVYFIQSIRINAQEAKNIIVVIGRACMLVLGFIFLFWMTYRFVPSVQNAMSGMIDYMISGVATLYGNKLYGIDASAVTRVITQREAIRLITVDTDILKFLFGHGYMTMYVDVPILQAFLDFGLIGGGLYTYILIIRPISIMLNRKNIYLASRNVLYKYNFLFFTIISITSIGKQLSSALPYGHDMYWGATFCWLLASKAKVCEENYK